MKRKPTIKDAFLAAILLTFGAFNATATPILLNDPSDRPFSAGDPFIQDWLIAVVEAYNTAHSTTFCTACVGGTPDIKVNTDDPAPTGFPTFGSDTLAITLPVNLNNYLVLHWGGQGGGVFQIWGLAIPPIPTSWEFTAPGANGLSSYALYGNATTRGGGGQVPEPVSLALIGAGLIVLGEMRHRG